MNGLEINLRTTERAWWKFKPRAGHGAAEMPLAERFKRCSTRLEESCRRVTGIAESGATISAAEVWIVENVNAIGEQIRSVRRSLRGGFDKQLPVDEAIGCDGLPRIYHVAAAHVEGLKEKLDPAMLGEFVNACQGQQPFTLAELWSVTMMLRIAFIDKLSDLVSRLVATRDAPPAHQPQPARVVSDEAASAERLIIASTITSLRSLDLIDWKEFVEATSAVEEMLNQDPAGVYADMTFESRCCYHQRVTELAKHSRRKEHEVAESAIACAKAFAAEAGDASANGEPTDASRRRHVGYYLLGGGRTGFECEIGYRPTLREQLRRAIAGHAAFCYFGGIATLWVLSTVAVVAVAVQLGLVAQLGWLSRAALLVLAAGSLSQFAIAMIDWICSLVVVPKPLMRMDYSDGIPAACRTLVVIPTMLTGETANAALLRQLELRYLANQDAHLSFALLTDFPDADSQTLPGDEKQLAAVRDGLAELNRRHRNPFHLLHRPRTWNAQEGVWMGSERKRGKIHSLNMLLRCGETSDFQVVDGDRERLKSVRFVITIDTDTRLPRDTARQMIGCMAHPLNRPLIDERTGMVIDGHAVLQPRVNATLVDAQRSRFSWLLAGDAGVDPYTRQTSLVYQDLFNEGSFVGKGIYDLHAWGAALDKRFPDNRVLSHDLIEGCFARSGFVGDVVLFESLPSRMLADASRRHRWIRGDWQIAAWLFNRAPSASGQAKNSLGFLSRWKIADNLRRSLMPVFMLAMLFIGWIAAPAFAAFWTLLAAAIVLGPALCMAALCFCRKMEDKPWTLHMGHEIKGCARSLAVEALNFCTLPYTAHCHLDAIIRALYRVHHSRRLLLEWTTADDAETRSKAGLAAHYERMWACTIAPVSATAILLVLNPLANLGAGVVLLAWLLGPMIAWAISEPLKVAANEFNDDEKLLLGRWSRQTWRYFETTVGPRTHWLAPDNRQEWPEPLIAARTSPTNIGMGLLANLSAYDLGYLTSSAMLERSSRTLRSMFHLEQHRGHLYNWYNTTTMQPTEPRYVSSVDSGNLWAALIVMQSGVLELRDRTISATRLLRGLRDTEEVVREMSLAARRSLIGRSFAHELARFHLRWEIAEKGPSADVVKNLRRLGRQAVELDAVVPTSELELKRWTRTLARECVAAHKEMRTLAFWTQISKSRAIISKLTADHLNPARRNALQELLSALDLLNENCKLSQLPTIAMRIADAAEYLLGAASSSSPSGLKPQASGLQHSSSLARISRLARRAASAATLELQKIGRVDDLCRQFCAMDFRFLYNEKRKLLAIGYNATTGRRDDSYYDLLASEARTTSFLAVCHGQLPLEHWFALGRIVTLVSGKPALVSWSGSMFEHLMPTLVMPSHPGTFLNTSCEAAVRRQIEYAREKRIPWGISESCYNDLNDAEAYRYRAFGAPGLGLDRGLRENTVIAPYASALAISIAPREALANLIALEEMGCLSPRGFYDAVDYTPGRTRHGIPQPCRIVMAHHSGMTLLALQKVLTGATMERRFMKVGLCEAHELLLQEKTPTAICPVNPEKIDANAPKRPSRNSLAEISAESTDATETTLSQNPQADRSSDSPARSPAGIRRGHSGKAPMAWPPWIP